MLIISTDKAMKVPLNIILEKQSSMNSVLSLISYIYIYFIFFFLLTILLLGLTKLQTSVVAL